MSAIKVVSIPLEWDCRQRAVYFTKEVVQVFSQEDPPALVEKYIEPEKPKESEDTDWIDDWLEEDLATEN
ncbi:hypothetical protein [Largemouth bass virus]|nr:hypothetical protein [Largemouth bass virus]